jgi:hypothetical protein
VPFNTQFAELGAERVSMVDIQTVSIGIASASVVAGVLYYIFQIRHQTRMRQTDLIMRLYSRYGSEGFQKTLDKLRQRELKGFHEYVEKYGLAEWVTVGTFFEGIGILLRRKLVDIDLVDDLFTAPLKMAWDIMKDSIIEARREYGQPTIFEWFEYLYNEMQKREQQLTKTK